MVDELTRPIVGIENRTAQEVFDIMAARIRRSALSPGSTGETEVTEAMVEAGHETARAWTDRYMDGSEFVNWQQGLPDIYRAMLSAAGERG